MVLMEVIEWCLHILLKKCWWALDVWPVYIEILFVNCVVDHGKSDGNVYVGLNRYYMMYVDINYRHALQCRRKGLQNKQALFPNVYTVKGLEKLEKVLDKSQTYFEELCSLELPRLQWYQVEAEQNSCLSKLLWIMSTALNQKHPLFHEYLCM